MNVYKYEMRQTRKSIEIWAVSLAAVTFLMLLATPLFLDESAGMRELLGNFPDYMLAAMGIDIQTFFSPVGFYSYIFMYISLAGAVQAMSLGLSAVSKETKMMTADFLLTKPARRGHILAQKYLAGLTALVITQTVFFVSAYAAILPQDKNLNLTVFTLISLTLTFLQLFFFTLGTFVGATARKIKSPTTVALGACFGFFILGTIGQIADNEALRCLSPLRYFDSFHIMSNSAYEAGYLAVCLALTAVFAVLSFTVYIKKDVRAAS